VIATNYFKIVERASNHVAGIVPFDGELETSVKSAWTMALVVRGAKPDRKIVLGAPVAIKGPWSDLPVTGVVTTQAVGDRI
jgi:hypothetical protein